MSFKVGDKVALLHDPRNLGRVWVVMRVSPMGRGLRIEYDDGEIEETMSISVDGVKPAPNGLERILRDLK